MRKVIAASRVWNLLPTSLKDSDSSVRELLFEASRKNAACCSTTHNQIVCCWLHLFRHFPDRVRNENLLHEEHNSIHEDYSMKWDGIKNRRRATRRKRRPIRTVAWNL